MTTYAYRLKAKVPPEHLDVPEGHDGSIDLGDEHRATLMIPTGNTGRAELVLVSHGFDTEEDAWTSGERARSALRIASLVCGLPIDVGIERERRDRSGMRLAPHVRDAMEAASGHRVLTDVHGLQVFPDDQPAAVVRAHAGGRVSMQVDKLVDPLRSAMRGDRQLTKKEALAMDLYFLSQIESSTRARVLALVTSLEVLSEQQEYPQPVIAHLEQLKKLTKNARRDADDETRSAFESFQSRLGMLHEESISAGLRSVVREHVPDTETFDGKSPMQFITDGYQIRSKLVHEGEEPADVALTQLFSGLRRLVHAVLLSVATGPHGD